VAGATFIPQSRLGEQVETSLPDKRVPVVVYCAGGIRSLPAAKILRVKGYTKVLAGQWWYIYFTNRTDLEPKPYLLEKNPHGIRYKELLRFTQPFSSKGLGQLQVKYEDVTRRNDIWVFVPGLRRTMRVGGGNRCDCLGGFVFNMDETYYFVGDIMSFTWKVIGVKEHLVPVLQPSKAFFEVIPGLHNPLERLERRKVWLVEVKSKDPGYCYGKMIGYLDPESMYWTWKEDFDRNGELWKTLVIYFALAPNPAGGWVMENTGANVYDVKIRESGPNVYNPDSNVGLKQEMFTMEALRKMGR